MKLKIALTVLLPILSTSVYGKIFFQEDFESIPVSAGQADIRSGSLDYQFNRETGNRLYVKDNQTNGVRFKLDEAVSNPGNNETRYLSFCLKSLNKDNNNKFAGVILYKDGEEVFGMGNDFSTDVFSFWTSGGKGMPIGNAKRYVDDIVHKIVLEIKYNDNGPEKLRIALDPTSQRSMERQPDHIWSSYEMELAFDEIRIRSGNNDCSWEFDELRIADNWNSVMPSDNNPGEYINGIKKRPVPLGKQEVILDGVARFWPNSLTAKDIAPSLALVKPLEAIGKVSGNWQLKPHFYTANGKKYAYFNVPAEYDLYGTGEVMGSLIRNGYKVKYQNYDNPVYGRANQMYQTHPWVLGLREDGSAFGILFDTTWISELDLRNGILFSVDDNAPFFPVIVIDGKDPQEIMTKLGTLTGTMPMPPRWSLGYQQCRWSYYPDARAREIADTFREKQIPCDVIWFDIHYMDEYRIFTFDKGRYPDPKGTNDYLHKNGFKGIWMIDPGVKYESGYSVFDEGTAIDGWVKDASGNTFKGPVWPGDCAFPDFTMPKVRKWWAGLYKDFMATGIDGVWNDMNEPAVFGGENNTMPMDNIHRGGDGLPEGPHQQYHNVYGMLMTKASREGIQAANPDKRPFVLTRANYIGGHRYAATWTGDNGATWEHLKWSIPMSISLGLSGQPFNGPDIGGFAHNATEELWGHWIACGAFYPFCRAHTSLGTNDQEPWEFGPEVEQAARTALERRYRLMPYLYTAFVDSHNTGMPVMLPAYFADPTDLALRMEQQAFMVGSDLLITPKWGTDVKKPSGNWPVVNLVGENSAADKYQCDIQVKPGSIIPLGPVVQSTVEIKTKQELTLLVVPDTDGNAAGDLYEDAGDGYEYKNGQYCVSSFTASKAGNKIIVSCSGQKGKLAAKSRIVSVEVIVDGKTYTAKGDIYAPKGITIDTGK